MDLRWESEGLSRGWGGERGKTQPSKKNQPLLLFLNLTWSSPEVPPPLRCGAFTPFTSIGRQRRQSTTSGVPRPNLMVARVPPRLFLGCGAAPSLPCLPLAAGAVDHPGMVEMTSRIKPAPFDASRIALTWGGDVSAAQFLDGNRTSRVSIVWGHTERSGEGAEPCARVRTRGRSSACGGGLFKMAAPCSTRWGS